MAIIVVTEWLSKKQAERTAGLPRKLQDLQNGNDAGFDFRLQLHLLFPPVS